MKNNKGQALIEFIIILPIIILLIMCIIDFANIISNKYTLESDLDTVVKLYQNNDDINKFISDRDEIVAFSDDNKFTKIILSKEINVATPILNNILGKNYKLEVSRTILHE